MGTSESEIPAEKLALYEKLVATRPDIERKGASMPYTSLNGNMFSFLMPDGTMALRLSEDGRKIFINKYKSKLAEQHGRVMTEYVVVPASLLKKTNELKKAFDASIVYIASLKAKPTTRKKAAKKAAKKVATPAEETAPKKAAPKKAAKKKAAPKKSPPKKAAPKKKAAAKKAAKKKAAPKKAPAKKKAKKR